MRTALHGSCWNAPTTAETQPDRRKVTDFLSKEELQHFLQRSDARGFWARFSTWAVIGLAFTAMALAVDHLNV